MWIARTNPGRCARNTLRPARSRSPAIHNAALAERGLNGCYVPLLVDDMAAFLATFTGGWVGGWAGG